MKRFLFLIHRWLGIPLCLLFVMWFGSGMVMMYTRMPGLDDREKLAGLERLDPLAVKISAAAACARAGLTDVPRRVRLAMAAGRPVYYILPKGQKWVAVHADDGTVVTSVAVEEARAVAERYLGTPVRFVETIDTVDQWTLSNSLNLHRPLHKFRAADEAATELYVSAVTGEVLVRGTRWERFWGYLGTVTHYGEFLFIRRHVAFWRQLMIWLAVAGTLLALTGMIVGWMRYRRAGYRRANGTRVRTPYRGVTRWHHWTGLTVGTLALTWIFSGMLYLNPTGTRNPNPLDTQTTMSPYNVGGVRANTSPRPEQTAAFTGGPLETRLFTAGIESATTRLGFTELREIELTRFDGRPYYYCRATPDRTWLVAADDANTSPVTAFPTDVLLEKAKQAMPGATVVESTLLTAYDGYYYSIGAVAPRRLPVMRVKFDDPAATWLYLDPHQGSILRRYDAYGRGFRYVMNGLHCLDFSVLIAYPPVWYVTLTVLCLLGLVLSGSAAYLGFRRLAPRATAKPTEPSARRAPRPVLAKGLLAAAMLGVPAGVAAQTPAASPAPQNGASQAQVTGVLDAVVVTASNHEESIGRLSATVQTFDRQQIERSTAATITDFLAENGVAFFSTWTPAQTSINLRGGATDGQGRDFRSQVVVLVNGRRAGTANLSKLSLQDVERIEIVRGAASLMFGSQAIGGVVNLITKDGKNSPGVFLRTSAGSWGFFETVGQVGGALGKFDYFFGLHGGRRGDYTSGSDSPQRMVNTSYRQVGGLFALGFNPTERQRVVATIRSDGLYDAGFRGSSWDTNNTENRYNQSFEVAYGGRDESAKYLWNARYYHYRDTDDFRWGSEVIRNAAGNPAPGFSEDNNFRRNSGHGIRLNSNLNLFRGNGLLVGYDADWNRLRNRRERRAVNNAPTTQVAPFDTNSNTFAQGFFFEDVQEFFDGLMTVRGGLRYDRGRHDLKATPNLPTLRVRSERYDAVTWRAGVNVKPTDWLRVRLGIGTGFRAPTPPELASEFNTVLGGQILGNPDLKPERATNYEIGTSVERGRLWADLVWFYTDIRDRIGTVPLDGNRSRFVNRAGSQVSGLELQSRTNLGTLDNGKIAFWSSANGVYHFRMRDADAAVRGLNRNEIERMYKYQGSVGFNVEHARWSARVLGTFNGPMYYETEENLLIPQGEPFRTFVHGKNPFWLVQAGARFKLTKHLTPWINVTNLLNVNQHPIFIALNRVPIVADTRFGNGGVGNSLPGRGVVIGIDFRR